MLQSPINYSLNVKSPIDEINSGLKLGSDISNLEMQQKLQQSMMDRQKLINQKTIDLMNNQNPSHKDYLDLAGLLPKEESENILKQWDSISKDKQDNQLKFMGQVMAGLGSGNPQIGINLLKQRAEAERNSGNEQDAIAYENYAKIAETDPNFAQKNIGIGLSAVPGGEKILQAALNARATESQSSNIESQIAEREAMLGLEGKKVGIDKSKLELDKQRLNFDIESKIQDLKNKGTQVEPDARKLINESVSNSIVAMDAANQMEIVANDIERQGGGAGLGSGISELSKKIAGLDSAWSDVRRNYEMLRNSIALKRLPPGPANDADVKFALGGIPSANSDSKTIAKFLRGYSKIKKFEAASESAKADWVNSVGSLGKPKSDIVVNGVRVPSGMSFIEYMQRQMQKVDISNAKKEYGIE